jgi:L-glyceraldehyde 3-phosphate reductase
VLRAASAQEVAPLVEAGTARTQGPFARCRRCGRVFWRGAHARRLEAVVADARAAVARARQDGAMSPLLEPYRAAEDRYAVQPYRRSGRSGLDLPAVSLGLWQNFGDDAPPERARAVLRRAFDLGVTHIDLANNYGPPYGSAEETFGRVLAQDLRAHRDELVVSTKAGWDMWPGPYGDHGSRKYLRASLDASLRRTGLEYVDVYYHHRPDPSTPLEETMGALDAAVRSGKALYAGISSYSATQTREAVAVLRDLGTPLLLHQPSYSIFDRWVERPDEGGASLLDVVGEEGVGCIAFSPLAQGLLTDRYLDGVPPGSRAARGSFLTTAALTDETLARVRALHEVAAERGQSLAQMALAWVLRDERVTSVLVGASSVAQLEQNVAATQQLGFTDDELARIEQHADPVGAPAA